jgi:hypothetical protein
MGLFGGLLGWEADDSRLMNYTEVHCPYIVFTLLLHFCHTVVTLLKLCCHNVVTLLSQCCHTVVTLLSHCCYTVVALFYSVGAGHGGQDLRHRVW